MAVKKRILKVLIACEESQAVCKAFRELGHDAYSNDIIECSGGHPEWHLQMDALEAIKLKDWDLMIAHPECTYLTTAGAARLYSNVKGIDQDRLLKGVKAKEFFMSILNHCVEHGIPCCIENPVPMKIFGLPKYDQIIQPYYFGHPFSKRTCLWLHKLPKLIPTSIVSDGINPWVDGGGKNKPGKIRGLRNKKMRSKTFEGIAKAMAEQWSKYILNQI